MNEKKQIKWRTSKEVLTFNASDGILCGRQKRSTKRVKEKEKNLKKVLTLTERNSIIMKHDKTCNDL